MSLLRWIFYGPDDPPIRPDPKPRLYKVGGKVVLQRQRLRLGANSCPGLRSMVRQPVAGNAICEEAQ